MSYKSTEAPQADQDKSFFPPRTSCERLNVSRYVSLHDCETFVCFSNPEFTDMLMFSVY